MDFENEFKHIKESLASMNSAISGAKNASLQLVAEMDQMAASHEKLTSSVDRLEGKLLASCLPPFPENGLRVARRGPPGFQPAVARQQRPRKKTHCRRYAGGPAVLAKDAQAEGEGTAEQGAGPQHDP